MEGLVGFEEKEGQMLKEEEGSVVKEDDTLVKVRVCSVLVLALKEVILKEVEDGQGRFTKEEEQGAGSGMAFVRSLGCSILVGSRFGLVTFSFALETLGSGLDWKRDRRVRLSTNFGRPPAREKGGLGAWMGNPYQF